MRATIWSITLGLGLINAIPMEGSPHNRIRVKLCPLNHVFDLIRGVSLLGPLGKRFFSLDLEHIEVESREDFIRLLAKLCRVARPSDDVGECSRSIVSLLG